MISSALVKCPRARSTSIGTGCAEPRVCRNGLCITALYTGKCQRLSREIQASDIGVLINITQDICQLKRAAEMVGQGFPVAVIHTEDANTQSSNCAGHAIAIKIKFAETWSPNISTSIHLNAIDYSQEIFLAQTETRNCLGQIFKARRNASRIE